MSGRAHKRTSPAFCCVHRHGTDQTRTRGHAQDQEDQGRTFGCGQECDRQGQEDASQASPAELIPQTHSAAARSQTSPGRKKLTEAKHAIKEARREYLLLARAAKKLEKLRDRKHELVDKHAAAAERALKLPRKKSLHLNMLALSNAESGWLLALAQAYAARLKAAWAWDLVRIAQIEQKRAEIERLRSRLWWPRV